MPRTRLTMTTTKPDGTSESNTYEYEVRIKKVIETLNKKTATPGRAICELKRSLKTSTIADGLQATSGKAQWKEYYSGDVVEIEIEELTSPAKP